MSVHLAWPRLLRRLRGVRVYLAGPADAWRLARLLAWALVLPLLKRRLSLAVLARLMWARPRHPARRPAEEARILAMVGRVYRPGRLTTGNCLERSLVLYRFLAAAGAAPCLVLGADRRGPRFAGHAWVVVAGQPIGETPADLAPYRPLVAFGAGGQVLPVLT